MSRYTLSYINEYLLTDEDKKMILDLFKERQAYKLTKCADNFLLVNEYERRMKVYTTDFKDILNEVRQLELYTLDWWSLLSSKAQNCINDKFYMHYKADNSAIMTYYFDNENSGEYQYYDTKLERIKEFVINNDLPFYDDVKGLDTDYIENAFNHNRLINPDLVKLRVIAYSIKEKVYDYIDFDEEDNIILNSLGIEKFIINQESIPLTTKDKMKKSISNSYNAFKNYALCNCDRFSYFITLTFADVNEKEKHINLNDTRRINDESVLFEYVNDSTDYEECVKLMTKFLFNLRMNLKRKGLELCYLGVPEYQKNGAIHYHFLMSDLPVDILFKNPDWIDRDYNTNKIRNSLGIKLWKYGISDVQFIKNKARISTYLAKYLLKSLNELEETDYFNRLNKKRYYCSNNLLKPEIEYDYFNEEKIEYCDVGYTIINNAFDNSSITKCIYTLNKTLL